MVKENDSNNRNSRSKGAVGISPQGNKLPNVRIRKRSLMADKLLNIKEESTISVTADASSDMKLFEFVGVDIKVKDEPISEDVVETNSTFKTGPFFGAVGDEPREIKVENIAASSEDTVSPAVSMSLCSSSGHFTDNSVLVKTEEDSEMFLDEQEESAQADNTCGVSVKNEEVANCASDEFCSAKKSEGADEFKECCSRVPGVSSSIKTEDCCISTELEKSGNVKGVVAKSVGEISSSSFWCKECELNFPTRRAFKKHLVTRHKKPLLCLHCPTAFSSSKELVEHMASHTDLRLFSCGQCGVTFQDKKLLAQHVTSHPALKLGKSDSTLVHPSRSSFSRLSGVEAEPVEQDVVDKRFSCTHCSSKFEERKHLTYHLETHTNRRPLSCVYCPAKFREVKALMEHLVSHSSDKLFSCSHCPLTLKSMSHLNKHLATHRCKRKTRNSLQDSHDSTSKQKNSS